jgi:hypothetical protein
MPKLIQYLVYIKRILLFSAYIQLLNIFLKKFLLIWGWRFRSQVNGIKIIIPNTIYFFYKIFNCKFWKSDIGGGVYNRKKAGKAGKIWQEKQCEYFRSA